MPLTQEQKQEFITEYGANAQDTGNTAAQVAMLSKRIADLTEHLKINKKDFSTRRGLMMMVGKRRRLLNYFKNTNGLAAYTELISKLGIRK